MAGYTGVYCIGGEGGFQGSDGINPIFFQILVGDGNRRWLEVHYFDIAIKPIGQIKTIVPVSWDSRETLLDACLAFFPQYFEKCPSLIEVKSKLATTIQLDFGEPANIPVKWSQLREEARPLFSLLYIYFAALEPVDLS